MSEKVVLHRGYCVKSPPLSYHKWTKRLCTLTLEHIYDTKLFHKTFNKEFNKTYLTTVDSSSPSQQELVFAYYKDEEDEAKDKALKKFLVNTSAVIDYPAGANNYTYVIKLLLGPLYNDREILLCFEDKSDHGKWLKAFDTGRNTQKDDSLKYLEQAIRAPVRKYEPVSGSSLQVELEKMRSTVSESRNSSVSAAEEEYNDFLDTFNT